MGINRENGYSATVEGFLVVGKNRIRLAKTNGSSLVLAEPCELPSGVSGELLVIIDGQKDSRRVMLPEGVTLGQTLVKYNVSAPF